MRRSGLLFAVATCLLGAALILSMRAIGGIGPGAIQRTPYVSSVSVTQVPGANGHTVSVVKQSYATLTTGWRFDHVSGHFFVTHTSLVKWKTLRAGAHRVLELPVVRVRTWSVF